MLMAKDVLLFLWKEMKRYWRSTPAVTNSTDTEISQRFESDKIIVIEKFDPENHQRSIS